MGTELSSVRIARANASTALASAAPGWSRLKMLRTNSRSIGRRFMLAKRKERLAEAGITDEQFARIHGPVGLNIGAKSPAEIAVSILGQIVEVRARRLDAMAGPKVVAA